MKAYQSLFAAFILGVFGIGLITPLLKPYCVGCLFGAGMGWLIHLVGTKGGSSATSRR